MDWLTAEEFEEAIAACSHIRVQRIDPVFLREFLLVRLQTQFPSMAKQIKNFTMAQMSRLRDEIFIQQKIAGLY